MLFLLHLAHKMRAPEDGGGRAGIVMNGSPLFNGAAESGPSNIRKWLLENDLVEAIIALPANMFFNNGIATYIWILDNTKHPDRKGLVQLIDGTSFWDQRDHRGARRRVLRGRDRQGGRSTLLRILRYPLAETPRLRAWQERSSSTVPVRRSSTLKAWRKFSSGRGSLLTGRPEAALSGLAAAGEIAGGRGATVPRRSDSRWSPCLVWL
ncbi:HsdM family class I SAM-dependent methyltransferase [Sphaerimonospora thailandensis]|uniref:site-specific DNA-methyltransferase (adenine-specific) n=1 Tax=Sphaerimonospora thailandensis TaxID=795644 RepID=A0A8J3RCJ7_9ACTN|nr:N-6 DNA methylase [Sphaerimonospora thailandensis]GIH73237.1 hypothetical protein Mth01_54900 [Sphaerimonospora thailandensis]